jgi:hypothetical protein
MSLLVRVHCGYPSYADMGEAWNDDDYTAYKFVQALKGHPIKGYATLRRPNGAWTRITAEAPAPAFDHFGEWGAAQVAALGFEEGWLIPTPSSDCLHLDHDPKGRRIAQAIAKRLRGFEVAEALHWDVQLPKASEGGPRDVGTLLDNLRVGNVTPRRPIVLVDDVITSGGHLLACARALRGFGHQVGHAICAAQTVHTHPQNGMFAIADRDLERPMFAGAS